MLKSFSRINLVPLVFQKNALVSASQILFGTKSTIIKSAQDDNPRITLVGADESVSIVDLEEAKELSKNTNLKLVKVVNFDNKTRRPLYRLISVADYRDEQLRIRNQKKEAKKEFAIKGEKIISFTSKIGEHDFFTRCKNINKWTGKNYDVKVSIEGQGDNLDLSEKLYKRILGECSQNCKVQQKSITNATIKFHIVPLPKPAEGLDINHQKREMHSNAEDPQKL